MFTQNRKRKAFLFYFYKTIVSNIMHSSILQNCLNKIWNIWCKMRTQTPIKPLKPHNTTCWSNIPSHIPGHNSNYPNRKYLSIPTFDGVWLGSAIANIMNYDIAIKVFMSTIWSHNQIWLYARYGWEAVSYTDSFNALLLK